MSKQNIVFKDTVKTSSNDSNKFDLVKRIKDDAKFSKEPTGKRVETLIKNYGLTGEYLNL